ncbi:uncharacterized protein LACBIDRAFT_332149 [Laccaria bicolor S238N-H82]|uniref:Predicted protein n=1 Tax=Laccaria bicolor (strain S238N-H82 / ATCC MYA-4686) TaxID=486041 RepID=B0DRR5_LACBS|nr:uncharacterized protein LACBIDRAFT_332149 [Laccaria bicolor S238N-H82]EDR02653.1 predicted protein [Laccaria bicolor S238N-H82]|eukprot:XP_001886697.1 predicted protein [Laccaria bicolor S238N-H82]
MRDISYSSSQGGAGPGIPYRDPVICLTLVSHILCITPLRRSHLPLMRRASQSVVAVYPRQILICKQGVRDTLDMFLITLPKLSSWRISLLSTTAKGLDINVDANRWAKVGQRRGFPIQLQLNSDDNSTIVDVGLQDKTSIETLFIYGAYRMGLANTVSDAKDVEGMSNIGFTHSMYHTIETEPPALDAEGFAICGSCVSSSNPHMQTRCARHTGLPKLSSWRISLLSTTAKGLDINVDANRWAKVGQRRGFPIQLQLNSDDNSTIVDVGLQDKTSIETLFTFVHSIISKTRADPTLWVIAYQENVRVIFGVFVSGNHIFEHYVFAKEVFRGLCLWVQFFDIQAEAIRSFSQKKPDAHRTVRMNDNQ